MAGHYYLPLFPLHTYQAHAVAQMVLLSPNGLVLQYIMQKQKRFMNAKEKSTAVYPA